MTIDLILYYYTRFYRPFLTLSTYLLIDTVPWLTLYKADVSLSFTNHQISVDYVTINTA